MVSNWLVVVERSWRRDEETERGELGFEETPKHAHTASRRAYLENQFLRLQMPCVERKENKALDFE